MQPAEPQSVPRRNPRTPGPPGGTLRRLRSPSPLVNLVLAAHSLTANPVRSFLSMLGIVIGVASVITMMALGLGSQLQIEESIRALGANTLVVRPGELRQGAVRLGMDTGRTLTIADADALLRECPAVLRTAPRQEATFLVKFGNNSKRVDVLGTTGEFLSIRNLRVETGRAFTRPEVDQRASVCVLGPEVAQLLFDNRDPLGQRIRVRDRPFRVIGVLAPRGGGDADWDERVYVPVTTGLARLFGVRHISRIEIQAVNQASMDAAQTQIESVIRRRRGLRDDQPNDFEVRNQLDRIEAATETSRTMTVLLAGIAAISLFVGGIGIMNIMLVSVTERTREIGIRRAVGARRADILFQFLTEAITLCAAGGVLGVLGGIATAWAGSSLAEWPIRISPLSLGVAPASAILSGVFFGVYPALRAASLVPLEALRHE